VLTVSRLLKLLRKEKDMISSLMSLGLTAEQAISLVSHSAISSAQRDSSTSEGIFDASDRAEGGGVITWLNDIEKDPRYVFLLQALHTLTSGSYNNWSPSLQMVKLSSGCLYSRFADLGCSCFAQPIKVNSITSKGTCSTSSLQLTSTEWTA
jgi:Thioredoxin-like domain